MPTRDCGCVIPPAAGQRCGQRGLACMLPRKALGNGGALPAKVQLTTSFHMLCAILSCPVIKRCIAHYTVRGACNKCAFPSERPIAHLHVKPRRQYHATNAHYSRRCGLHYVDQPHWIPFVSAPLCSGQDWFPRTLCRWPSEAWTCTLLPAHRKTGSDALLHTSCRALKLKPNLFGDCVV